MFIYARVVIYVMKNKISNLYKELINTKQRKIIFNVCLVFCLILLVFGLSKTNMVRNLLKLVGIYTQEEKVIEIASSGWENGEPGSVHITKTADWISLDTVEVTYDVDTIIQNTSNARDVIVVMDTSASMLDNYFGKSKIVYCWY